MQATPSFSEVLGDDEEDVVDDVNLDVVAYGVGDDAVVLPQSSSRPSPLRNGIATTPSSPSSPSSKALVLHVESTRVQENVVILESPELSQISMNPSLTKEHQHHDLPLE